MRGVVVVQYREGKIFPVRNLASPHESYGAVEVPLQRLIPAALDRSERSASSCYTLSMWLGGPQI